MSKKKNFYISPSLIAITGILGVAYYAFNRFLNAEWGRHKEYGGK